MRLGLGLAVGFGIWATHFVAMLAFRPGFTLSYDVGLTAASLAIAILVCGAGALPCTSSVCLRSESIQENEMSH